MSLNLPIRRLAGAGGSSSTGKLLTSAVTSSASHAQCSTTRGLHTTPSRPAGWLPGSWLGRKNKNKAKDADLPPGDRAMVKEMTGSKAARDRLVDRLRTTTIGGNSIFADELALTDEAEAKAAKENKDAEKARRDPTMTSTAGASLVKGTMARAVDPDPRSRVRWERKMVMRRVAHVGLNPFSRESRAERIKRTEREVTVRSQWMPTSVKKLVHLARQIQGKTVSEAMLQMRFSKKKMAKEIGVHLNDARDLAVVSRGMGLGEAKGEVFPQGQEVEIKTKDGKFVKVDDPTRLYIAQAWVNRGPWRGIRPDYRARGRAFRMMRPSTCISVVIKEEKTRIREHEERKAKKQRQGPWVHLPDRPITAQRQYYSW